MNSKTELLLHLSLVKGVGPSTTQILLDNIGIDSMLNLYQFNISDFKQLGLSYDKAAGIVAGLADKDLLLREQDLIQKYDANLVTILDDSYPELLRHIQGSPAVLYWRGTMQGWPKLALAIVGSRKANYYGKSVINELVPKLVQVGCAIVSGGALGADAMAHRATLDAGGTTLAVLGSGLSKMGPKTNTRIFNEMIANGGAVVSSFSMLEDSFPGNFPARNRIISGLSHGCLVVQAASRSGARITANFALEQGRDLFAVPGPFGDPLSAGCHELVLQGAKLVHSAADILNELPGGLQNVVEPKKIELESGVDALIVGLCRTPKSIDDLQQELELSILELQDKLFDLQLKGRVRQNFAGLWHL